MSGFFTGMKWSAKTISRAYPTAKMSLSIIIRIEEVKVANPKEKLGINQRNRSITFPTTVFGVANHKLNNKLVSSQRVNASMAHRLNAEPMMMEDST